MARVIVLVGIPASGKSTWSLEQLISTSYDYDKGLIYGTTHDAERVVIVSSDNIRAARGFSDVETSKTFDLMHKYTRQSLDQGITVIYDATNLSRKKRIGFLDQLKKYKVSKECVVFLTPYLDCVQRNNLRDRVVPATALLKMLRAFQLPLKTEGWDKLIPYKNTISNYTLEQLLQKTEGFKQDNSHHVFTLAQHLYATRDYVEQNMEDSPTKALVSIAALYHDIGKLYTKDFHNAKGELTNEAHYYGHENVSTYLYLCANNSNGLSVEQEWYVATLINWHMRPYLHRSEKTIKLDETLLGTQLLSDLDILHQADVNAH